MDALRQLVALGDSINHTFVSEVNTPPKNVLQDIADRVSVSVMPYYEIQMVVALGASVAHCKSVARSFSTRQYAFLAFAYLTYNRAARVIQRRFKARREAVLKIQSVWRRCISDPSHPICRRRLMREFREADDITAIHVEKRRAEFFAVGVHQSKRVKYV
jgi:hypothetical protein